jgi:hypothetical protein
LKVRRTFELFGPATKRHLQAHKPSFCQPIDFLENDNRHDDGVFALFGFLQIRRARLPSRRLRFDDQKTSGCVSVT